MNTETALPITEQENPRSKDLSSQSTAEIVALMNEEDALVAAAVQRVLGDVVKAVDETVARLEKGGRLFYTGTGTSGRLGVLDASECPPTFGVSPELVQGVIAGGYDACHRAVEASEDDADAGAADLKQRGFGPGDVLVGIAASGRTPYTVGAVKFARSLGAFTVGLTVVPGSPITEAAELSIVPGCWTRSIDRIEQAQGRHRTEDGSQHDLDSDDGATRLRERQPHVAPASAEHQTARSRGADHRCRNGFGLRGSGGRARSCGQ